ncbi:hypothetical protein Salat_0787600 [Sesamum alatum]|uniref:Uncharacterized protein n=1 Tax=Sesamum alatum TaxID=300844 RepID=A0AAE1YU09_9LAMI|nr:hypothetical protein Salat_0787600 [Sesamum alatum]
MVQCRLTAEIIKSTHSQTCRSALLFLKLNNTWTVRVYPISSKKLTSADRRYHQTFSTPNIFTVLEAWDTASDHYNNNNPVEVSANIKAGGDETTTNDETSFEFQKSAYNNNSCGGAFQDSETEVEAAPHCKRQKLIAAGEDHRVSHIYRREKPPEADESPSLRPSLFDALLLCQKTTKASAEPETEPAHSPSTPQSSSPYKPWMQQQQQPGYLNSPSLPSPIEPSPCNSSTSSINDAVNELVANSKSAVAEVEVKFLPARICCSRRCPHRISQDVFPHWKNFALEILHVHISTGR